MDAFGFKYITYQDTHFIKLTMCTLSTNHLIESLASISQIVTVPGTKWSSKICSPVLQSGRELSVTSNDKQQPHPSTVTASQAQPGASGKLAPGQLWPRKNAKEKQYESAYSEKLLAKYKISEFFFLSSITHGIKFRCLPVQNNVQESKMLDLSRHSPRKCNYVIL